MGVAVTLVTVLFLSSMAYSQAPPVNRNQPGLSGNVYQNGMQARTTVDTTENIMIILDASGSMIDKISGADKETKMVAAKRTVLNVIKNIPPSTRVGLRVYGNASHSFFSCRSTELMVPLGVNNRYGIASQMLKIRPAGMTPISYTISKSLEEDFYGVSGKKSIILISDGIESCDEDPCRVAVRMQQRGVNVKVNVIGLGLTDYAAVKQLRCVALGTKGQFYTANTAAELAKSLNEAIQAKTTVQGTILKMPSSTSSPSYPQKQKPKTTRPPNDDPLLEAVPVQTDSR